VFAMPVLQYPYNELLHFIRDCFKSGVFCDVALHCGRRNYKSGDRARANGEEEDSAPVLCHGLILSAILPHFGELADVLRHNDDRALKIYMPDFERDVVAEWIGKLYDSLVEGKESVELAVPAGFAGAFGLFSPAIVNSQHTSVVIKPDPDLGSGGGTADQYLKSEYNYGSSSSDSESTDDDGEEDYDEDPEAEYVPQQQKQKPKKSRKRKAEVTSAAATVKKEASTKKRTPRQSNTGPQQKPRQDYNAPRFVKEPPYEETYSSMEEEEVEQETDDLESEPVDRKRGPLPNYDKAMVRNLFRENATLERVLFRHQAAGTIPDMYEKSYFVSIGAVAYESQRSTIRFRPITTSDSTMMENANEFDEFAQILQSCYGLSTSDVFFQPYSPYRKLLYLPWRDQLRDAARRIKSVYGDDKELIEAAKVEHQKEMQAILADMVPLPARPRYGPGYHKEKTVILDSSFALANAVGLGIIVWKQKGGDKSKYECVCSPFPEGALISKLLKAILHFWFGDSKCTPNIPNWLRDKFVSVFDLHATQAALNDPFRQCEKCGELIEFTDYQVHVERHTLALKQCCGIQFKSEGEMKAHIRVYHANDNVKNKAVMCPHCKRSFAEKNIEKHWAVCYER
jgi:hypothetical protein